jgi:pilus assembly protein CpaF
LARPDCGYRGDALAIPGWVAMQTWLAGLEGTGEIRLRALVMESLRMRPSRVMG